MESGRAAATVNRRHALPLARHAHPAPSPPLPPLAASPISLRFAPTSDTPGGEARVTLKGHHHGSDQTTRGRGAQRDRQGGRPLRSSRRPRSWRHLWRRQKPEPISVDYKDINKLIYAGHFLTTIFELEVEGARSACSPRDYQLDVVTDRPVHVDFLRLTPGSRVRIGVPVHVVNREASPGLKKGGALNLVLHTVDVMAPADAIPEFAHHRPHRSRLPWLGACLGISSCRRAASRSTKDRSDGRDHRPADGHGEETPRRAAAPQRPPLRPRPPPTPRRPLRPRERPLLPPQSRLQPSCGRRARQEVRPIPSPGFLRERVRPVRRPRP